MNKRLFEQAEAIRTDRAALRKRLQMSAGCLIAELRPLYADQPINYDLCRMNSRDGKHHLQWVNNGNSTIGTVYCVRDRVSLGCTSGV